MLVNNSLLKFLDGIHINHCWEFIIVTLVFILCKQDIVAI